MVLRTLRSASLLVAITFATPSPSTAADLGAGVAEIQDCIDKNLPTSGKQSVALERTDKTGQSRRLEANAFWKRDDAKRSRFLMRIEAPPDERGSAFLFLEGEPTDDLFAYLPDLGKVRRITAHTLDGSFFASDFSYEDVLELQSQTDHARVERQGEGEIGGRPVDILMATPSPDGSSYSKVVSHVDRETCVVLRAELYGKAGQIAKEVVVDFADVTRHGERWIPSKVTIRDLQKGSESRLIFEKADWDAPVPDRLFTQGELGKGH
jgi:hypothetical protein